MTLPCGLSDREITRACERGRAAVVLSLVPGGDGWQRVESVKNRTSLSSFLLDLRCPPGERRKERQRGGVPEWTDDQRRIAACRVTAWPTSGRTWSCSPSVWEHKPSAVGAPSSSACRRSSASPAVTARERERDSCDRCTDVGVAGSLLGRRHARSVAQVETWRSPSRPSSAMRQRAIEPTGVSAPSADDNTRRPLRSLSVDRNCLMWTAGAFPSRWRHGRNLRVLDTFVHPMTRFTDGRETAVLGSAHTRNGLRLGSSLSGVAPPRAPRKRQT